MPISVGELKEFLNNQSYARFINTNLHLHTPATRWDWDGWDGQTRKAATISVDEYFEELNKTSLELVAITDHNCIDWCEPLIELARKARKEGSSKIYILPGVEITTYEGPHIIAIFEELKNTEEIKLMLTRLGMSGKGEQEDKVGRFSNPDTIQKVIDEIGRLNGIVIGPHVDSKDGLWGFKDFRSRNDVLNNSELKILAASSGNIKRVKEPSGTVRFLYKNMDTTKIENSFSFINISDCHRLDDFEVNTTWIKLSCPSLEGVRQIIYEPELRVSHEIKKSPEDVENAESLYFTKPVSASHPHIIAISISGGMLNGLKVQFSPNLNSIIGKNYAGKSALLDCLRFALNAIPSEENLHDKFADRMRAFIGEGGEVRVYINSAEKVYGISRTFLSSKVGRGTRTKSQIDGTPDVFLLWDENEFKHESGVTVDNMFPVEVYPQGEVVKIKDNVGQQMKIVDSLSNVDSDIQDLMSVEVDGNKTLLGKLKGNRETIITQNKKKEDLKEAISSIKDLEEEIQQLETLSTSPIYTEKKLWSEQEVEIDSYKKELSRIEEKWLSDSLLPYSWSDEGKEAVEAAKSKVQEDEEFDEESASPKQYANRALKFFNSAILRVKESASSSRDTLKDAVEALTKLETSRKARVTALDEEIRKKLGSEETGTKGDVLINHITQKRIRLTTLLEKQREFEQTEKEIERLRKERAGLLKNYREKWEQVQKARSDVVEMIEKGSASSIKAEIIANCDREQYRKKLEDIVDRLTSATNKISRKEAQLGEITENVSPNQLVAIIQNNDSTELTRVCSEVTQNTARILLSMGEADVYELEECLLNDKFVISYKRHGETGFTPVESGLSGGEQALALISVAMVPKPLPLIIDQPEDELGPALITHELVEQIRKVKSKRQLMFVTHVPNIPVLADSEQVIYIEQKIDETKKRSELECCGSLEEIEIVEHLLELDGGDVAFEKRNKRYSRVIKSRAVK